MRLEGDFGGWKCLRWRLDWRGCGEEVGRVLVKEENRTLWFLVLVG